MKSVSFVSDKRIWQKLIKLACQKSQDEINQLCQRQKNMAKAIKACMPNKKDEISQLCQRQKNMAKAIKACMPKELR